MIFTEETLKKLNPKRYAFKLSKQQFEKWFIFYTNKLQKQTISLSSSI